MVRFQLKSSHCSYRIYGNNLNSYLDPGAGSGYNYQHLEGRNGSDTYVLQHGYGEFNEINNYAEDNKLDTLQLGLEFGDISVSFHSENDVILASKTRPSSLSINILDYSHSVSYQHLQIVTTDKITFEVSEQYPFKDVVTLDRTSVDSPQTIEPNTTRLITTAQDLKGSLVSSNNLTGSESTIGIEGGAKTDVLRTGSGGTLLDGKDGSDTIYGGVGSDIIFGGDGNDTISADAGDDYIYGGSGADVIDGGNGSDTIFFRGDGFLLEGVRVNLYIGFGVGVDAEGDKYENIENVYGTIHNDTLIGSDSNNKLCGADGNDTLVAYDGNDQLNGGEGEDLYLLYKPSGLKVIDNYAEDGVEDTISLFHLNSTDVCVFLVDDDLYLQVDKLHLASALFHGQHLTVIVVNWNVGEKNRHLKVVFNDTLWEGFALSAITSSFDNLNNSYQYVVNQTKLHVDSRNGTYTRLSWQVMENIAMHPNTELCVMYFDRKPPKVLNKTQVDRGMSLDISTLDPDFHYVFVLALEQCSAISAVSHTLITFGRERACSVANKLHSSVLYSPVLSGSSPAHGTSATIKCDANYTIGNQENVTNIVCLDKIWIPLLPVCRRTRMRPCTFPSKPADGEVSITGLNFGSKAHYICHKGYRLNGRKERNCNGRFWGGRRPSCQPLHCPAPQYGEKGTYIPCQDMNYTKTYGTFSKSLEGSVLNFIVTKHICRATHFMDQVFARDGKVIGKYHRAVLFVVMESG